jgi:ABC-type nitrate/sulfonate/bicarbonate transport system substrate-binding protein/CheY-like chemotaxis protein
MAQHLEIWGTKDPNISAQLALAVRMDLFKQEAGLDVTCRFLESGTTMPYEILKAERKPFAWAQTPITAILLRDKGLPAKVVAPLADIAGTQQVIIAPQSGIVHPKDLEGKHIGIAKDAAMMIAFSNMAHDYDVDVNQIRFLDLLPHAQLGAFREGMIDGLACWEPWTTKARKAGGQFYFSGARSSVPGTEGDVSWLIDQACLMAPEDHIRSYPAEVSAILRVLLKATELINSQRKDVARELAEFFDVSQSELIAAMRKNAYSMRFDNLFRIGILVFRDYLYNQGDVSQMFAEQDLYDTSLLKKIDRQLVALEATTSQNVTIVKKPNVYYRQDVTIVADSRDIRFVIADDSVVVRASLEKMVAILGGEIVGEASTGQEAIDMFTRCRPNFVTMDLSMPEMSGIDAIKRILQIDPQANVIVISGTDLKEVREEVFDLGVKIFIVKPFDPLHVAEIIGLLLL